MNPMRTALLPLCVALAFVLAAQAAPLYRYIDANGHVVYSDQPPPPGAKAVQAKQLQGNVIDTDTTPLATRQAMQVFPVTLYTFDCGEVCREAQALLVKRGVPYTSIDVTTPEGGTRLKALTGGQSAPALQVGDKLLAVGFNESRWQALLDEAGYPKTAPPLRAGRGATPAKVPANAPVNVPAKAPVPAPAGSATTPEGNPPAPTGTLPQPPTGNARGSGYPQ
ncbi:MAG: glutaredoxin family protein [Betaproteobacteria bacterium]|nr:glutaredoxin family protein [Betaproteobacteria bacterium]